MAINAAEMSVLNDFSHIKSCQSQSTQSSVISGLTSAFWPCFIGAGGIPGHPITAAASGQEEAAAHPALQRAAQLLRGQEQRLRVSHLL